MSSTIIYTRTIACLVFSEMKGKKRKLPVETKHLRRLIRSRIQKKFNMYDRIYGRPENVYIDCKDPDRKVETKRERLTCLSSDSCNGIDGGQFVPTDGKCPPKRVTSPVRPFTGAKTGTSQALSSNESHLQAIDNSFSYNQSHFCEDSSMSECNIISCDSQTRPLSISPLHCEGFNATNRERTDTQVFLARKKLDFSQIKDHASRQDLSSKIMGGSFESLQPNIQLNDSEGACHSVKLFLQTHCNHSNRDLSTSLSILVERLKALALYFSKSSPCQYIAWRICSALKDILCLEAEQGTNYWNHSSLSFLRMYLQVDSRNGFILSPWPNNEAIGTEDSGMEVSNEDDCSTELSSVST